jgi:hypothetical protein
LLPPAKDESRDKVAQSITNPPPEIDHAREELLLSLAAEAAEEAHSLAASHNAMVTRKSAGRVNSKSVEV